MPDPIDLVRQIAPLNPHVLVRIRQGEEPMPYERDEDLPDAVKALTGAMRQKWRTVFNAAYTQYDGDDGKASAVAWAAVKDKDARDQVEPHG